MMSAQSKIDAAADHRANPLLRLARGRGAELQVLIGVVILVGVFATAFPGSFATFSNLQNMSTQAAILLVITIAQTFALLVGGFDLSVGANMAFASTLGALTMTAYGTPSYLAAFFAIAASAVVGLANGVMIGVLGISPFIATLATLTFLGGYSNVLAGGASIAGLPNDFIMNWGGGSWGTVFPSAIGLAIIALVVAYVILGRSRLGLYVFSLGGSREAARLGGVRVRAIEVVAYTICGALAGLAGVMLSARVGIGQADLGSEYDLMSIAAAVIGGVAIGGGAGRLSGVFLGVVLLTVLSTGLNIASVNEFIQQMVTGAVLVVAVLVARARGGRFSVRLFRRRTDS
jgi:ribose transport system permease protein